MLTRFQFLLAGPRVTHAGIDNATPASLRKIHVSVAPHSGACLCILLLALYIPLLSHRDDMNKSRLPIFLYLSEDLDLVAYYPQ